jgi:hypothetical protein
MGMWKDVALAARGHCRVLSCPSFGTRGCHQRVARRVIVRF